MRILLVNKYNYLRSGTERYMFNLKRLLERYGHQVITFAMHHPRNESTPYDQYFLTPMDHHHLSTKGKLQAVGRVIYYRPAAQYIAALLDEVQPDVVHLQNIYHHISPAILPEIARRGIPIVQTLHDYKLVCPNYLLYTEGAPCTRCRNGRYFQAVQHRCLHGLLTWSLLGAIEMSLHKAWRIYERHVATFIAPSAFMKAITQECGVPASQLRCVPHFLFSEDFTVSKADGGYCAYVGRLSHEKGLPTLIRAMRQFPQAQLLIVGEGPMRPALEQMVAKWGLTNVQFTGYLTGDALTRVLAEARFTVLPSEWYEVFGQSILESFAVGKPVVASRIGGMPELIDEGEDGLLFTPGDADELAACLRRLWDDPEETRQMGLNGRRRVLARYTPENHYRQLYSLYERLVNG